MSFSNVDLKGGVLRLNKNIQEYLLVFISTILSIIIFLVVDFAVSKRYIPYYGGKWEESVDPYIRKDSGWYELKRSFAGKGHWGDHIYDVNTDIYGFRSKTVGSNGQADYIFLGDSFTFGVNGEWDDTFVGMFEGYVSGRKVINAGVPSYSPTAYLHQIKKMLSEDAIKEKATVIVGLDISDVQDEAACWESAVNSPKKMQGSCLERSAVVLNHETKWDEVKNRLRFTGMIFKYIDMKIRPERYAPPVLESTFNQARSAFTWDKWSRLNKEGFPNGYAPLGVSAGLNKIGNQVEEINKLVQKKSGQTYILIYPWPGQLVYAQKFNYEAWARKLCHKIKCAGVIDTFPVFMRENGKEAYEKYYLQGDVHFNKNGNMILFEEIRKTIEISSQASR